MNFKKIAIVLATASCASWVSATPVSADMALKVAGSVDSSYSKIMSCSPATDVTAVTNSSGETSYFVVGRQNGKAVVVSSDTDRAPVVAVVDNPFGSDGRLVRGPAIWDILAGPKTRPADTNSNGYVIYKGVSSEVRASSDVGADGRVDENHRRWSHLLRDMRFSSKSAPLSAVPQSSSNGVYVLDGFDTNGKYTHWGQVNTVYHSMSGGNDVIGSAPVYNYYMLSTAKGGAGASGLNIGDSGTWPCGCVATAIAAASQYLKVRGIVQSPILSGPVYKSNALIGNKSPLPGVYDWDSLPSNFGGNAAPVYSDQALPASAKELLARVAYNCGIMTRMNYGTEGSGTNQAYMIDPSQDNHFDSVMSTIDMSYYGSWSADGSYVAGSGGSKQWLGTLWVGNYSTGGIKQVVEDLASVAIPLGVPVILGVSVDGANGHCILCTGYYRDDQTDETWIRLFMGWNGSSDSWYRIHPSADSISGYNVFNDVGIITRTNMPSAFAIVSVTNKYNSTSVSSVAEAKVSLTRSLPASAVGFTYFITNVNGKVSVGVSRPFIPPSQQFISHTVDSEPGSVDNAVATFSVKPYPVFGSYEADWASLPSKPFLGCGQLWVFSNTVRCFYPYMNRYFNNEPRLMKGTVSVTSGSLRSNFFEYGTPRPVSEAVSAARTSGKPLVVITGVNGTDDPASKFVKGDSSVVVHFIDAPTDQTAFDTVKTVSVFDASLIPEASPVSFPWSSSSSARLSYGTYDNGRDIRRIISEGIRRYNENH